MNNRILGFVIAGSNQINALAFVGCLILTVASLIGNASPTPDPGKFITFTQLFALWLATVSLLAIGQLMLERHYVSPGIPGLHLLLCALMTLRLWHQWDAFPEIWAVSTVCLLTYARHAWFHYRQAKIPVMPQMARHPAGPTETAAPVPVEGSLCDVRRPHVSFADVAGMEPVKERLLLAGREIVQGNRPGKKPRNGILLTGKPGNGKTFLAEALAGELKLPFLTVTYGDVASMWVGDTPSRLPRVFKEARAKAPCVLFLDEVDSLLSSRDNNNADGDSLKSVNVLLTELVDIRGSGVIIMAATNHLERLDSAAVREGRFDFKIEIPPPDAPARRHLILSQAEDPLADAALNTAVDRWAGFSAARITAIMEEVNRRPQAGCPITYDDLSRALRTLQGRSGYLPENTPTLGELVLSPEARTRLASLADRMSRSVEIEAMGGSVPHGVLFYGPPGTGKTLWARTLAKTAQWAFLSVSGLDLLANPAKIDELLDEASELRPCVVFIDEADDILADRRMSQSSAVTNKLLAAIDGAGGRIPDVLFIAATNHPGAMDAAALRGGRFTEKLAFSLPDASTIGVFLAQWQERSKATWASGVSLPDIARQLLGLPLSDVQAIMQMAVNLAIGRTSPKQTMVLVNAADIDLAVEQVCGEDHDMDE